MLTCGALEAGVSHQPRGSCGVRHLSNHPPLFKTCTLYRDWCRLAEFVLTSGALEAVSRQPCGSCSVRHPSDHLYSGLAHLEEIGADGRCLCLPVVPWGPVFPVSPVALAKEGTRRTTHLCTRLAHLEESVTPANHYLCHLLSADVAQAVTCPKVHTSFKLMACGSMAPKSVWKSRAIGNRVCRQGR